MSVDLKIELTGAVVYVRQTGVGGEKVVALLLGRSNQPGGPPMSLHRPTFVFDPDDVAKVTGLPAQVIHMAKHRLGLQVDMTGFDLVLGEASGGVLVDERRLPFSTVVNLKDLLPAKAGAAVSKALIDRSQAPMSPRNKHLVVGRLFLDSGLLYAAGPVARELRDTLWRFTYHEAGQEHVMLETLATDRVAFRCVLPGGVMTLANRSEKREASIELKAKGGKRRVTARLACVDGLPPADAEAGGSYEPATDSHFEIAYDILDVVPPYRPTPKPPARVPGKNCFKAAQIIA